MADPKFANLPGIAYDQPDVYETPDVPDTNPSDYSYEDTEAEAIERLHLSSDDSTNKFKGKYLTGNIDYSCNAVRGGCWELAAHGEKETPIEKYRRIKCEMEELMNEISELSTVSATSKREKDSYEAVSLAVNSAQRVLGSLRLENVLGTETTSTTSDIEIKKLIAQVDGFNKGKGGASVSTEVSKIQLEQTKRIAELEARLHIVETIVGTHQPDKLSRLASTLDTNGTLLDSVQQISAKAALLQPAQLDQIETKISVLTSKLDEINEKVAPANGKKGANDDNITALYDIAKRTEPIAKILPDMLQRMQALEKLHNHANGYNKIVSELESREAALVSTLNANKVLLQKVQEAFALNLESVNHDVGKLESRLKASEKK